MTMLLVTLIGGSLVMVSLKPGGLSLGALLSQSEPLGITSDMHGRWTKAVWPTEHFAHEPAQFTSIVMPATLLATGTWLAGIGLATVMYGLGYLNPEDARRQFSPIYNLLINKWWFDELYDAIFVKPALFKARMVANFDRYVIDAFIDWLANFIAWFSRQWDAIADRGVVDGFVNLFAGWTYSTGLSLRKLQTGQLRQYVVFIVVGAIAIFVLVSFVWTPLFAK